MEKFNFTVNRKCDYYLEFLMKNRICMGDKDDILCERSGEADKVNPEASGRLAFSAGHVQNGIIVEKGNR
jgi:hypothetical protein